MLDFEEYKQHFVAFTDTPIASGGQKQVYRASHSEYGEVVVKVLKNVDARLEREIEIAHEHEFDQVPKLYVVDDVIVAGMETKALTEEYIEGNDFRRIIEGNRRFTLMEACDFLEESLRFIKDIATVGIVHRDIKPENIIDGIDGRLHFLDFGIARVLDAPSLTETNQGGPNTPGYAAPEQFTGQKRMIDTRADIFSIGVVTYELITGENPFRKNAASAIEILYNTATITPTTFQLKGDKDRQFMGLLVSMMSRSMYGRPKNAEQALDWLNRARLTFTDEAL